MTAHKGLADPSTPSRDSAFRAAQAALTGSRGLALAGVLASVLDTGR